jgi:hypothetical protein
MLVASPLIISGFDDLFAGAKQKVEKIVADKTSPGETISLSVAEVNALFQGAMKERNVQGVTKAKIDFAEDTGTWSGIVDFDKLPELAPYKSNFLLSSILKGSSPVSTTASLVSSGGKATFDVKQVTVGETKFEGGTLGFLIKHVVLSDYPDIELGEPFDLEHNVDSIKLAPGGIRFKIKN